MPSPSKEDLSLETLESDFSDENAPPVRDVPQNALEIALAPQFMALSLKIKDLESRIQKCDEKKSPEKWKSLNDACEVAKDLHKNLKQLIITHIEPATQKIKFQAFQKDAHFHIQIANESLSQHRGFKQILYNILLAILGVGIVYASIAGLTKVINKRPSFWLPCQTASSNLLDKLEKAIVKIVAEKTKESSSTADLPKAIPT